MKQEEEQLKDEKKQQRRGNTIVSACPRPTSLELPVVLVLHRRNRPSELLTQGLGEELLKRYIKLLGENDRQTRVDVILSRLLAKKLTCEDQMIVELTILEVPRATSLLPSRSSA